VPRKKGGGGLKEESLKEFYERGRDQRPKQEGKKSMKIEQGKKEFPAGGKKK